MQVCHFQHLLRPFDKNEPSRFLGEGVFFKAKLIGILEVAEARGDRMCQEALADLKMAIRAAGEHKQRISVHVAIDGLRLRDEKTGDSLYHHPVHKISFIAQDMSDSRAFGYIFGSPDTGHRFFGIKTDKAASQVVIAMRDLFQVVFELKKKEIELAKQQLEGKSILSSGRYLSTATLETTKNGESSASITRSRLGSNVISSLQASTSTNGSSAATSAGNTVAELVDLEQELNSLQRGLHQMERLTPPTDPFGDSFTPTPAPGFLPPPPNSSRGLRTATSITSDGGSPFSPPPVRTHFNFEIPTCSTVSTVVTTTTTTTSVAPLPSPTPTASPIPSLPTHQSPRNIVNKNPVEKVSVEKSSPGILDTTTSVSPLPSDPISLSLLDQLTAGPVIDVFTELDPLGTGRSKPYVDKKHFFQELKNPPKKILKDLVGGVVMPAENLFQSKFDLSPKTELLTTITSVGRQSGGSVSIAKPNSAAQLFSSNTTLFSSDPFAETDPFDNTDPFAESLKDDPFVSSSIDFPPVPKNTMLFEKNIKLPDTKIISDQSSKINFLCAALKSDIVPLQVSLPPEPSVRSPKVAKQITIDKSSIRQRPQSGKQQHIQPSQSPPPPLPPKKPVEKLSDISVGPPLPLPARRRPTTSTPVPPGQILINPINWPNSSTTHEDDYLAPAPALPKRTVPSPSTGPSPGLDITLAQLLTCGMDELAGRLHMPAELLSRMTLAQLTGHLHEYLQTSNKTETLAEQPPKVAERPPIQLQEKSSQFEVNFEENFTSNSDVFEVNFDNFDKSNKDSYDRYAVFREIEAESLNIPVANDPIIPNAEEHDSINSQLDLPCDSSIGHVDNISSILNANFESLNISPVKINQPSPSSTKLEELKNTINNIQKNSMSPTPDIDITLDSNIKSFDNKSKNTMSNVDRYAALRDLSTVEDISRPLSAELSEEPSSAPLQVPKERKKSDEKSDGFDHSDFFDCIDNSLSLTHPDDAFRKSPLIIKEAAQIPEKTIELPDITPIQLTTPVPLVSGSISDVQSGSSPENVLTAERESGVDERDRDRDSSRQSSSKSRKRGDAWALLPSGRRASPPPPSEDGASPWSSDSKESPLQQVKCWPRNYSDAPTRRHRRNPKTSWRTRQTSSSSRDVSPWEEDPPPRDISTHARSYHRERHESVGSSERRDSAGSRERRDSGSGRDRQRRRHQSRNDDKWSDDRDYMGRRLSPCKRSSSREMHRDRAWPGEDHWRPDERGYSTVGRRESRRRGEPPWQGDDPSHRYSCTMGNRSWRRSGSSGEGERRSGGGGSSGAERSRSRIAPSQTSSHRPRPARHRQHRSPFQDNYSRDRSPSPSQATSPSSRQRHQHHFFDDFNHSEVDSPIASKNGTRFRFSNDFSEKDSPKSQNSPFENDFVENTSSLRKSSKYEGSYSNLEKQSPVPRLSNFSCFKYDKDQSSENVNVSPASVRPPPRTSPNSTRSLFEDDFSPEPRNGILRITDNNGDSCRKNVIPEGEEVPSDAKEDKIEKNVGFDLGLGKDVPIPENKGKQKLFGNKPRTKPDLDIKKSESVNIFARDSDPFDGDDFFNSAASEKSKDAWKGEFASFDDI